MMFDVVIIGSGFGGSIPAYLMSKSGMNVCLIERGPWRDKALDAPDNNTFSPLPHGINVLRDSIMRIHHPLFARKGFTINKRGLFDIFMAGDMNVVCSSSVGGGSHVYGGLHGYPLQHDYWDNLAQNLSSDIMNRHYEEMLDVLGSHNAPEHSKPVYQFGSSVWEDVPIPEQPLWGFARDRKNTKNWHEKVDFSAEGMFGSPTGQKTTLDTLLLQPAVQHYGLDIRACHEAISVHQMPGYFQVVAFDHTQGKQVIIKGSKLIIAAGCMNTIKLLHHSKKIGGLTGLQALGKHFSGNADIVAFWKVSDNSIDHPSFGPYERILSPVDKSISAQIVQAGVSGLHSLPLPKFIKRWLRSQLFLAAMGIDNSNGEIYFDKKSIRIRYEENKNPVIRKIWNLFESIAIESKSPIRFSKKLSTVHPLGGAVIGDNKQNSVINGYGEVHDIPNLFITDSSVFPKALGAPPSLSIAAWSSYVSQMILAKEEQKSKYSKRETLTRRKLEMVEI